MMSRITLFLAALSAVKAQQVCTAKPETHPALTWSQCSTSGCSPVKGSVVVDANWRWVHAVEGYTNCFTGNSWNSTACSSGAACAKNCCVDGADYQGTYGVTTSSDSLSLQFVTQSQGKNVGSRLYLMQDDNNYQMFTLLGNEFSFDVDVSQLGCGLNGALYFVSMDQDGGKARFSGNAAGAKYGTGYCDAQCPRDVKFIDGVVSESAFSPAYILSTNISFSQANSEDWVPSPNDPNSGTGGMGTCCAEMDIWEANSISTAYTAHPCTNNAQHSCKGDACGGAGSSSRYGGTCDPDGCDFNAFRQGNETFYGPGGSFTVDTTKKVTVTTRFIKGSDGGLSEIKRFYSQGGKVFSNPASDIAGVAGNSLTKDYCTAQKSVFGDPDDFAKKGGLAQMGAAVAKPMVLVMSLWDDVSAVIFLFLIY